MAPWDTSFSSGFQVCSSNICATLGSSEVGSCFLKSGTEPRKVTICSNFSRSSVKLLIFGTKISWKIDLNNPEHSWTISKFHENTETSAVDFIFLGNIWAKAWQRQWPLELPRLAFLAIASMIWTISHWHGSWRSVAQQYYLWSIARKPGDHHSLRLEPLQKQRCSQQSAELSIWGCCNLVFQVWWSLLASLRLLVFFLRKVHMWNTHKTMDNWKALAVQLTKISWNALCWAPRPLGTRRKVRPRPDRSSRRAETEVPTGPVDPAAPPRRLWVAARHVSPPENHPQLQAGPPSVPLLAALPRLGMLDPPSRASKNQPPQLPQPSLAPPGSLVPLVPLVLLVPWHLPQPGLRLPPPAPAPPATPAPPAPPLPPGAREGHPAAEAPARDLWWPVLCGGAPEGWWFLHFSGLPTNGWNGYGQSLRIGRKPQLVIIGEYFVLPVLDFYWQHLKRVVMVTATIPSFEGLRSNR